jgi:hypothetical protein
VNPVDKVVESIGLDKSDAALEVIAVRDQGARADIHNYILEKTQRKKGFGGVFFDILIGTLGAMLGHNTQKPRERNFERDLQRDPSLKARLNAAEKKLNQKLFTCTVKAYGNLKTLRIIQDALPSSPINNMRRHSTAKSVNAPSALRKPSRYRLQNALSNLYWITPLLILSSALYLNLLDPLRLNTIDILTAIVAVASGFPFLLVFRKRNPIVLCVDELSLLVSMPTAVRRLPVGLGATLPTRRHLPSIGDIEKKPLKEATAPTHPTPAPPGKLPIAELPCPHCGSRFPIEAEYCPRCGWRLRI